jgi:hypothetical protein
MWAGMNAKFYTSPNAGGNFFVVLIGIQIYYSSSSQHFPDLSTAAI